MKFLRNYYLIFAISIFVASCFSNNPYPDFEREANIYYDTFEIEPKKLDPAQSYSSNEYEILNQIYEGVVQYHFLKRPYELEPLTARAMPNERFFDKNGRELHSFTNPSQVRRVVYDIKLKSGIKYQNHPAFYQDKNGKYLYHLPSHQNFPPIKHPNELSFKGTRELEAADYVYQIKRLGNPLLESPVFPVLAKYIDGFTEYYLKLRNEIARLRQERKKAAGIFYSQEQDEKENPIYLDLRKFDLPGVEVIDKYAFRVTLKKRYPQFIYWMAMPFFAPVAWEVDRFYVQGAALRQNISLNRFPVGTGAFQLDVYKPNYRIILGRNPNFHAEYYPMAGEKDDDTQGLLVDRGKKLPFIDKAVFVLEKEDIPRWNKFLQGYYDTSGINSDVFDSAIRISPEGSELTDFMKEKNIRLLEAVSTLTFYYAFNMLDDVVGGYSEDKIKLRQAISIAINMEEYIEIFMNGRGIAAQGPIPPEIFGYQKGKDGFNPFIYDWDTLRGMPRRKSIAYARKLLKEAGYPNGMGPNGKPLIIFYDSSQTDAGAKAYYDWLRKQFGKINLDLQIRKTDYNQFQDKVRKGNFQMLRWGWHADYPDPENFMFLLFGPNGKVRSQGENAANYANPEFDKFFTQMESMHNSPAREKIIKRMLHTVRHDAPWIWGVHPVSYALYHQWYRNAKPMTIGGNTLKYKRLDTGLREQKRKEWNQPVWYPLLALLAIFILSMIPGYKIIRQREKGRRS